MEQHRHQRIQDEWTPTDFAWGFCESVESRCKDDNVKKVRFSVKTVSVYVFIEEAEVVCHIPCLSLHQWCRHFWNLQGQPASDEITMQIMRNYLKVPWMNLVRDQIDRQGFTQDGEPGNQQQISAGEQHSVFHGLKELLNIVAQTDVSHRTTRNARGFFVETWLLVADRLKFCSQSRRIEITPDMTPQSFQQACWEAWVDVVERGEFRIYIVKPHPEGLQNAIAHVLLVQDAGNHNALLLRHRGLPIPSLRAVLFSRGAHTLEVLRNAQLDRPCWREDAACYLCAPNGGEAFFDTHDVVEIEIASFMLAEIRITDFHDEDGEEDDVPSEHEEQHSEDEVSTMYNSGSAASNVSSQDLEEASFMVQSSPPTWVMRMPREIEWHPDLIAADDDDGPFMGGEVEGAYYDDDHIQDIENHLQVELQQTEDQEPMSLAITFGLGINDLGRRDTQYRTGDRQHLQAQVAHLWNDHVQRADATIYMVFPQPRLATGRYIVLLVGFDYGDDADPTWKKVLVIQDSAFDYEPWGHPYAARLNEAANENNMVAQLALFDCFPYAIRTCDFHIAGRSLQIEPVQMIVDGSLVEVFIGAYPEYVSRIRGMISDVERFYVLARANLRSLPDRTNIILRVHAVSPRNQPLGYRDLQSTYETLGGLSWVANMQQLWPFGVERIVDGAFVSRLTEVRTEHEVPVYHFVISYARSMRGIPIVVRQTARVIEDGSRHQECWAAMMRIEADDADLHSLRRHPFWLQGEDDYQAFRDGQPLPSSDREWIPGEVLDISAEFDTKIDMMMWLWNGDRPNKRRKIVEAVNLLQVQATRGKTRSCFAEICEQLQEQQESEAQHDEGLYALQDIVKGLLRPGWVGLNHDFSVLDQSHPMIAYALQMTPQAELDTSSIFHIYTDGSCKSGEGAWAFVILVLVEFQNQGCRRFARVGYAGDKIPKEEGEWVTSADTEAWAIVAMSDFLLSRPIVPGMQIHCYYDAQTVGHAAFGEQAIPRWKTSQGTMQRFARTVVAMVQRKFECWKAFHVHSHEGNPYNECADTVANMLREGTLNAIKPILRVMTLYEHPLKEWAWTLVRPTKEIPDLKTMLQDRGCRDKTGWLDSAFHPLTKQHGEKHKAHQKEMKIATINVGSFHYDIRSECPVSMKAQELAEQFGTKGLDIVAIQEARSRHSCTVRTGMYDRIVVEGTQGAAGAELWFHSERMTRLCMQAFDASKHVATWHADSRVLAVHVECGILELDVINVYAPQSGQDEASISSWWEDLSKLLEEKRGVGPLILLGDFNARIGSVQTEQIGPCGADFETLAGELRRQVCEKHNLWIPTTWDHVHRGPSWTFKGPKRNRARLDYFAVNDACADGVSHTELDLSIDVMNGDRDHYVLTMTMLMRMERLQTDTIRRKSRYDRQAACVVDKKDRYDVVSNLPQIEWHTHVGEHWSVIRDHMQTEALKAFPLGKRRKKQTYISDQAWQVLCDRKEVHSMHRQQQHILHHYILKQAFTAWKLGQSSQTSWQDLEIHTMRLQEAVTYEQRARLESKFQYLKRKDWKQWVDQTIAAQMDQIHGVSSTAMFQILQPKKMVQRAQGKLRKPLPGMIDSKGSLCTSEEQIAIQWQVQFSEIEHAVVKSPQELCCKGRDSKVCVTTHDLQKLPSLIDFVWATRTLNCHKAPGLDGLGAELFQAGGPQTAMRMYSLFMKTILRQEYIPELTGGWLLALFKGKGNPRCMNTHRGILLEPTLSRCFSRAWRPCITQGMSTIAEPGQWGGRAGMSCTGLHLEVRMWQSNSRAKRMSQALVFVDIRAAFYSISKALVATRDTTRDEFHALCKSLDLPESAQAPFWRNLQKTNAVGTSTNSKVCSSITAAMLENTWFTIPNGDSVQFPSTGCRPGDPLADLYFSSVLAFVLEDIHQRMAEEGLIQGMEETSPVACSVTWVDDIAFNIMTDAKELVQRTIQLLSIVVDVMTEYGLSLNFGPSKTTAMLTLRGKGSTAAKQDYEAKYKEGMWTLSEHRGACWIATTNHYKHLGGFVTASGNKLQEIRVRAAQATQKLSSERFSRGQTCQ